MRLLHTEITPLINEVMSVDIRNQPFLWCPFHSQPSFHSHPELELVYILEGYGKRIIGNKVEPFESDDMVFIGANVPHLWLSDPVFYNESSNLKSRVIVAYFNLNVFSQVFESIKEFEDINEMIRQSSKGIKIFGETRRIIAEKLKTLVSKKGFEKVDGLLQIMNLISISSDKSLILTGEPDYEDPHPDKLIDVIKFITENLHKAIALRQVADIACMTEQSFSRYFKKRTKKSFSHYLYNLRIEQGKKMLIQSDKTIADIAFLCGYNSSSHFCKAFKYNVGISPLRYKEGINK